MFSKTFLGVLEWSKWRWNLKYKSILRPEFSTNYHDFLTGNFCTYDSSTVKFLWRLKHFLSPKLQKYSNRKQNISYPEQAYNQPLSTLLDFIWVDANFCLVLVNITIRLQFKNHDKTPKTFCTMPILLKMVLFWLRINVISGSPKKRWLQ